MGLEVRLAHGDEVGEVGRITVEAYQADGLLEQDDPYAARLADAADRAAQAELWVVVEEARLLGSVTYCVHGSPWAELAGEDEGELRMLSVTAGARRRGVARSLVRHCISRSWTLGHTALVLSSLPEMHAAHRLYESFGFVRTPELDWSPMGGVQLLGMRLTLT